MSIAPTAELAVLAEHQHGVLHRDQLHELGLTDRQVRYRTREGLLVPFLGDTFRIAGAPPTALTGYRAATLGDPSSVLGFEPAAHLHQIGEFGPASPVVLTDRHSHHEVAGIAVRRRGDLLDRHRTVVEGIPVTTVPRTLLDLAAHHHWLVVASLVDGLVDEGRLSIRNLFDEFDLIARRGRNGTTTMRIVLEPRLASLTLSRSELEKRGLAFLRRHGFPKPTVEFRPPWAGPAVARVDVAYVDQRVVIEFDGRKWHDRSGAFETDRLRDQLAAANGWVVVRITWRQLHEDPNGVAERLRSTLQTRTVGVS